MKMSMLTRLGMAAAVIVATAGCGRQRESDPVAPAGTMERTGSAVDRAAENTRDAVRTGVEKTGEGLERAGSTVEEAGRDMQD